MVLAGAASTAIAFALPGCTGSDGTSSQSSAESTTTTRALGPGQAAAYTPPATGAWETIEPADAGWTDDGLEALVALVEASNSRTLIVLSGGRIVAERYWQGRDEGSVQDIASCQKSVTSMLCGVAVDQGLFELDDAVSTYLPAGWTNAGPTDEAKITIRHLLTMSSGLHPRTLRKVAEPGTRWEYNTDAYQKLRGLLEAASGDQINEVSRAWLFDPIGVGTSAEWAPRRLDSEDATGAASWGLLLTARDMARVGLLAQRHGRWDEIAVVPADWLLKAWTPLAIKGDYGYLWWLLGRGRLGRRGAPEDWVAALGAQDQKIYVVPSLDLVVARQGLAANDVSDATSDFDAALMQGIVAARA